MDERIDSSIDMSKIEVLIVDDEPLNILILRKMLSVFSFKVVTASCGNDCLCHIENSKPSLVLLDLKMPDIDGYGVLRRMRSNPDTADIPAIVLSAYNDEDSLVKAYQLGACDFLEKPINMGKLIDSVVNTINKHLKK